MFEIPTLIVLAICATRMHRSLVDFASRSSQVYDFPRFLFSPAQCVRCISAQEESHQGTTILFSKTKRTDTAPTARDRVEIVIHTSFEQHPTSLVSGDDSSTVGIGEQVPQTVGGLSKLNLTQSINMPSTNRLSTSHSPATKRLTLPGAINCCCMYLPHQELVTN